MTILFTTWYLLDWHYPQWLWIVLGVIFVYILYKRFNRLIKMIKWGKKQKAFQPSSSGLSTSFALALWFGTNAEGTALLVDGQGWALIGLFFASHLLLSDNVISVNSDKKNKKSTTSEGDENQIETKEEGVQLIIVVTKKDSGKKNTVKLNLSNMKFINKFIITKFKDKFSKEGIDLEEIYLQAKENPEVGVILDVEHEDQHVVISIE
ncbi:MAG: hypothetical protein H8E72_06800 [Candidatus Marinimicrobia bacterium]|nr:hypothetical protein [Candidatus Neomarinimicrobiota bacterium]